MSTNDKNVLLRASESKLPVRGYPIRIWDFSRDYETVGCCGIKIAGRKFYTGEFIYVMSDQGSYELRFWRIDTITYHPHKYTFAIQLTEYLPIKSYRMSKPLIDGANFEFNTTIAKAMNNQITVNEKALLICTTFHNAIPDL